MPVHKVSGGWKWGKSGKTYDNKADADRQARAIYANGYTGKAVEETLNLTLTQLKRISQAMQGSQIHEATHDEIRRKSTNAIGNPFEVRRDAAGNRMALPEKRHYLGEGEEAPPGVFVQPGPRGGKFWTEDTARRASNDPNVSPDENSPEDVEVSPRGNMRRDSGPASRTRMNAEEGEGALNTLAKLRQTMNIHKIPESKESAEGVRTPGYTIVKGPDIYRVKAQGDSDHRGSVARRIEEAIDDGGFSYHRKGYEIHVKPLAYDTVSENNPKVSNAQITDLGDFVDPLINTKVTLGNSIEGVLVLTSVLSNARHYLSPGETPPHGVNIQQGPKGGQFFETPGRSPQPSGVSGVGQAPGPFAEDQPPSPGKRFPRIKKPGYLSQALKEDVSRVGQETRKNMRAEDLGKFTPQGLASKMMADYINTHMDPEMGEELSQANGWRDRAMPMFVKEAEQILSSDTRGPIPPPRRTPVPTPKNQPGGHNPHLGGEGFEREFERPDEPEEGLRTGEPDDSIDRRAADRQAGADEGQPAYSPPGYNEAQRKRMNAETAERKNYADYQKKNPTKIWPDAPEDRKRKRPVEKQATPTRGGYGGNEPIQGGVP